MHPEQEENLDRVAERIGGLVLAFCAETAAHGDCLFYMEELRNYVYEHVGGAIAPDSPGRILRMLRTRKQIKYNVLSRRDSLYEIVR